MVVATDGDTCPQVAESETLTDDVGVTPLLFTVKLKAELAPDEILEGDAVKLVRVITGDATVMVA